MEKQNKMVHLFLIIFAVSLSLSLSLCAIIHSTKLEEEEKNE